MMALFSVTRETILALEPLAQETFFLEGTNLSIGALGGSAKLAFGLGMVILEIALNFLTHLEPLDRGCHQDHGLKKYMQKETSQYRHINDKREKQNIRGKKKITLAM